MCGIVGAVAKREVGGILLEGLKRLEYRGYDSAGLALIESEGQLTRLRRMGKVAELISACNEKTPAGSTGIAHTRWATHGEPSEINAHPHLSNNIAVVHNGIIENHEELRDELELQGYVFESATDTEVIAHLVHATCATTETFREAVTKVLNRVKGAYAIAVLNSQEPERIIAARAGSPLVVGLGIGENYIASDQQALRPVTDRFIFLEEGELVEVTAGEVSIFGQNQDSVESRTIKLDDRQDLADKGQFRHYMQKEIFEQPDAIDRTLSGRITEKLVLTQAFGPGADEVFKATRAVQIVACGSSYYSGLVASYWFEQ